MMRMMMMSMRMMMMSMMMIVFPYTSKHHIEDDCDVNIDEFLSLCYLDFDDQSPDEIGHQE